jgi:hypothetical protein
MSEYGELGKKLKEKIFENQGKVSFAFGIAPILAEAKSDLRKTLATNQKVDVGIILMDWYEKWFGGN